jgi:D-alanyl-lipoteichoic acid acyltransferase DltB (MBOAT superfamily)
MSAIVPITSLKVWLVLILAVVLLTPLTHAALRRAVLALINLLFVALCVGPRVLAIVLGLLVLYGLLHVARRRCFGPWAGLLLAAGAAGLFVLHKMPGLSAWAGLTAVNPLLTGIGFSYVCLRIIDVWRVVRSGVHVPPGLPALINYVLPFHMLTAGPIQSYDDYVRQPAVPAPLDVNTALTAFERIAAGLFKKFVLAWLLLQLCCTGWRAEGWYRLVEMNVHFLWIYLDFSAYTDIAVGFGLLLGAATPENFNRPYLARNLTDFWERWHISLSQFIRRNLFVPLQMTLMRCTGGRHMLFGASLALFVSFVLCGAWHGLTQAFLIWGTLHAGGLVVCNLYKEWLKRRLGPVGLARYRASVPIRLTATVATYQFVAFSLMLVGDQWRFTW